MLWFQLFPLNGKTLFIVLEGILISTLTVKHIGHTIVGHSHDWMIGTQLPEFNSPTLPEMFKRFVILASTVEYTSNIGAGLGHVQVIGPSFDQMVSLFL